MLMKKKIVSAMVSFQGRCTGSCFLVIVRVTLPHGSKLLHSAVFVSTITALKTASGS